MDTNPVLIKGRMGYEFSLCSAGSEILLKKIIQKFEKSHSAAARFGYELFVHMKESDDKKFKIKDVEFQFLRQKNNNVMKEILEPEESGGVTQKECEQITAGILEHLPGVSPTAGLALLSLADLFKYFLVNPKSKYKSVIVSTILSYGRDGNMLHQCGIMALKEPHNMFLFYEPYGLYSKYKSSYKECHKNLFSVLQKMDGFKHYKYSSYHDYFGLTKGIQGFMLDYGQGNFADFNTRYNAIKVKMGASSEKWKYEGDTSDKTFPVCTLMDKASYKPTHVREAAQLYYEYSAKTCVSIFSVECARLMVYIEQNNTLSYIKSELASWYATFTGNPTSMLLDELDALLKVLYDSDTKNFIDETFSNLKNDPQDICQALTSV
jgi:hypothetical protein